MRFLGVTLLLLCAATAAAQQGKNNLLPEGACASAPSAHAHRYSDVRMAEIEVREVDRCGFSFVDLENNTLGLDNYVLFSKEFIVARLADMDRDASRFQAVRVPRDKLKKGTRGVLMLCRHCRAAFALRVGPPGGTVRP